MRCFKRPFKGDLKPPECPHNRPVGVLQKGAHTASRDSEGPAIACISLLCPLPVLKGAFLALIMFRQKAFEATIQVSVLVSILVSMRASFWSQIGHTSAPKSIPFGHDCLEMSLVSLIGSRVLAGRQASDIMSLSYVSRSLFV